MKFLSRLWDYFTTACGIVGTISWTIEMENAKGVLQLSVCAFAALFMAICALHGIKELLTEKQEEVADNS